MDELVMIDPLPVPPEPESGSSSRPVTDIPMPVRSLLFVSACGVLWHVLLLVLGGYFFVSPVTTDTPQNPQASAAKIIAEEASPKAQRWYQWDALWFVHLSRYGYVLETNSDGTPAQSNIAFTPGLAILATAASDHLSDPWSFLLGLNVFASLLAMLGLGAIAWRLTASRPAMVWSVVAFNVWPWRFFLVAPYQEAAGAALVFWAIFAMISGQAGLGFALSMLSAAFRLNAIGLMGGWMAGCMLEILRGRDSKKLLRSGLAASGALAGWVALLLYFRWMFGDTKLGVTIQSTWGRQPPHLSGIIESLASPILNRMTGSEWLDWTAAWAIVVSIPFVYGKFGSVWAASLAGLAAQALSTGRVLSFGRLAILACPFFVLVGLIASDRPRFATAIFVISISLQVGLAWRFGHGLFAG